MKRATLSAIIIAALGCIGPASLARADDGGRSSVAVAFGRGLNTAQPGNVVNHAILPDKITVNQNGVLHFLVAGFHQPTVYLPGTEPSDIAVPVTGTFVDDPANRFYLGILPAGGPPQTPVSGNPSNAQNRLESITFAGAQPGTYLVICNVRGHFLDGMFAFVRVKAHDD